MSGLPHPFGRDYELRGNEIVAVPNRTGGGMTAYEALANNLGSGGFRFTVSGVAHHLTPDFERALRRAYDKGYDVDDEEPVYDPDSGVTAGVEAMVEES